MIGKMEMEIDQHPCKRTHEGVGWNLSTFVPKNHEGVDDDLLKFNPHRFIAVPVVVFTQEHLL